MVCLSVPAQFRANGARSRVHSLSSVPRARRSRRTVSSYRRAQLSFAILRAMTDDAKILSRKAQALSPSDRIALIEEVLESLDKPDPEVERLWLKEAADRLA